MTTREPVNTRLIVEFISPLYEMQEGDILALQLELKRQVQIEYVKEVQRNLNLYGCQKLASLSDSESIQWIESYTAKTSEGIAKTYNTQLKNQISRMYEANPRGNRFYYLKGLEEWTQKRNAYKVPSISLNTMTAARQYAAQTFREKNNITGKMIFVGPPPVCRICIRLKARGPVSVKEAKKIGDSQHVGCPHRWESLVPKKINCDESWRG